MKNYYQIAVNTPFNGSILTYSTEDYYDVGNLVLVPLGKRKEKGCVLQSFSKNEIEVEESLLKNICKSYELPFSLKKEYLSFLKWVTDYYHYPLGKHIFDVLPSPMKRPKEIETIIGEGKKLEFSLTLEQLEAVQKITSKKNDFAKYLLHGVTGAGKTTVYIEAIKWAQEQNKNVLFLIPEINLTPQFLKVLSCHIKGKIFAYHSAISKSEKYYIWQELQRTNGPYVLVGVRSSIFLPFENLGLIIVDEEHDLSFKQVDRLTYNARDVATKLAQISKCSIVLGSATPTLESFLNAKQGKMQYIRLANRPKALPMPDIELIDARSGSEQVHSEKDENSIWPFSKVTIEKIRERIEKKEQVLVFVNRLGFASFIRCRSCGHGFECLNCSSTLKYFKKTNSLNCPTCEFKIPYPSQCPKCGNLKLVQKGFGTEKLAEVLEREFRSSKIARFDRSEIKTFNALKDVLENFEDGKIDILVGTQMLSKGHDFKNVNLVVVLGVDGQLNFPDFRSNERVFQQITQVSGRPGRSDSHGKVLIETLSPDNQIFSWIKEYNFEEFYQSEMDIRETLKYPPYCRISTIYINSRFQDRASRQSHLAVKIIKTLINSHFDHVEVLGPKPAFIEKRANMFTWTLMLKSKNASQLHNLLTSFEKNFKCESNVTYKIDIDPQNIL